MASKHNIAMAFKSVITFLGKHEFGYDINSLNAVMEQNVDEIQSMVKEPEYEHGTLMARICGVEAAKNLHLKTYHYSKALGYDFDSSTGQWYLTDDAK